ncbi:MAG: DUF262 domain-containing protein [Rhodospirillaceae bacterium]
MSSKSEVDDQLASQDEYEGTLAEGIDDDTLRDDHSIKKFSITSYGADYSVESLVGKMKSEAFIIPDFQRRFVWSQRHASKFIESLLMELPVPGIFLYKDPKVNHAYRLDAHTH